MLCLDHVFENGSRDRRMGRGQGVKFLQALKVEGWPPDIQILCYNCNTAKSRLGKCPHQDAAVSTRPLALVNARSAESLGQAPDRTRVA